MTDVSATAHVVVVGIGTLGQAVVRELVSQGIAVVAVDRSPQALARIAGVGSGVETVQLDAFDRGFVEKASLGQARGLVTTLSEARDNLFLVANVRRLNPSIVLVSRSTDRRDAPKFQTFGAAVVNPAEIAGNQLMRTIVGQELTTFAEAIVEGDDGTKRIAALDIQKGSSLAGLSLERSEIQARTGCTVLGLRRRRSGPFMFRPKGRARLPGGGALLALGTDAGLDQLAELLRSPDSA